MSIRAKVIVVLVALLGLLLFGVYYYHDAYSDTSSKLKLANTTISDMQTRQRDVEALDAKYTGEFADAKSKLADLQRCVASGKCGLRVNVIKQTTSTPSLDDATRVRLTDTAQPERMVSGRTFWRVPQQVTTQPLIQRVSLP